MNYILKLTAELEAELESLKVNEEISENEYLMSWTDIKRIQALGRLIDTRRDPLKWRVPGYGGGG